MWQQKSQWEDCCEAKKSRSSNTFLFFQASIFNQTSVVFSAGFFGGQNHPGSESLASLATQVPTARTSEIDGGEPWGDVSRSCDFF